MAIFATAEAANWVVAKAGVAAVLASSRTLATIVSSVASSFTVVAACVLRFLETLSQLGQSTRVELAEQLVAKHMGLAALARLKVLGHSRFDSGSLQVATFQKIYLKIILTNETFIELFIIISN